MDRLEQREPAVPDKPRDFTAEIEEAECGELDPRAGAGRRVVRGGPFTLCNQVVPPSRLSTSRSLHEREAVRLGPRPGP
jgi:hypothetical protein